MGRVKTGSVRLRKKSIQLIFWYNGRRCYETLHLNPTKSNKAFAERKLARIVDEIERGVFDYREHFPDSDNAYNDATDPLIKDALEAQLESQRGARSTMKAVTSYVRVHMIPEFGDKRISQLTIADVEDWLARTNLSKASARKALMPLNTVIRRAMAQGAITRNPLEFVQVRTRSGYDPQKRKVDPFTGEERSKILEACLKAESYQYGYRDMEQVRNMIQCWMWSGMRKSEVYALQWRDVDFKGGYIYVNRAWVAGEIKNTKTPSGQRYIEMQDEAREALERQKQYTHTSDDAPVFPNPNTGEYWRDYSFHSVWNRVLMKANVRRRSPNQCRHTFASMMLSSDDRRCSKPMWVAKQLGHSATSTGTVFAHYAQWMDE